MHQANRRRSFADCRRHALHVARAYIANRKHARQTGLENIRSAPQRPACGGEIFRRQIWSSLDERLLILNNASFEPSRVRTSSGHHENVPNVAFWEVPKGPQGGTGKAEDAKLLGAGIIPKPCPRKRAA